MITGATLHKTSLFNTPEKLELLETKMLTLAKLYHWQLEAWAVFTITIHMVTRGEPNAERLDKYLKQLHCDTARELNARDQAVGRRVWFNFWDTRLTFQRSYLARLNYVHQNPVNHNLVKVANQYPWCSAGWFERTASAPVIKTIYSFKIDNLEIYDEY